jgi:DNA invertase Pin-like site-specific DNA recombinase
MYIGYARVSTQDQNLNLQVDALQKAGCDKVYHDIVSGSKSERAGLNEALDFAREGDVIVVWRLDRLGRSIQHLIQTIVMLKERKIGFKSLQETIDTTTAIGKLTFHLCSAFAEFERNLIIDRTNAGLTAARLRGKLGGRPSKLDKQKIKRMRELYDAKTSTVIEICRIFDITKKTFYNHINKGI